MLTECESKNFVLDLRWTLVLLFHAGIVLIPPAAKHVYRRNKSGRMASHLQTLNLQEL
ncbi:MAG: hypothetical protein KDA66_02490 [Planctomycetaceae bacterium]|nr:hypothetical protein [Planctomycetaceae bacterium]